MTPSRRIILNTLVTYGRSLVAMGLGLFISRWVLAALGKTDFGLYGVVGAIVCFVTYLNTVLASSVARYYAYAIGEGTKLSDPDARVCLCRWFNTAMGLHVLLALGLVSLGYPIGCYVISHFLVIPAERLGACIWVYRFSLLSVFVGVATVPYVAMFTAFQRFVELALFDLVRIVGMFGFSYWLLTAPGDRLIAYAAVMAALPAGIMLVQVLRARLIFPSCRLVGSELFVAKRIRDIGQFALWQMLGIGGALGKIHGSAILVNLGFGPSWNASYSVATQFSAQTSTLSGALLNALTPVVATSAGEGNHDELVRYAVSACRFAGLLVAFFAVPLVCESGALMRLWLLSPPVQADALCVCFAIAMFFESLSTGYVVALNANGRIGRWQMAEAVILLGGVPALWLAYRFGGEFLCVGYLFIALSVVLGLERIYFVKRLLEIPVKAWMKRVLGPCLAVVAVSAIGAWSVRFGMGESFLRLLCVGAVSLVLALTMTYCVVLDGEEKVRVMSILKRLK